MSVCVTIRTKQHPAPDDVLNALVDAGEKIVVTSKDYPSVKFGTVGEALRGIELNEEDNGVEVRVCSFGSAADYRLFSRTVKTVMVLCGEKAFLEDDDECKVTDPLAEFGEQWVQRERESGMHILRLFSCKHGEQIVLYGLFADICIGPHLFKGFGISVDSKDTRADLDRLQNYLVNVQWHLANLKDTSSRLAIPDPENPDSDGKRISLITIKEGKVTDFDYISHADLLGIMDLDDKDGHPVLIPFEKILKVIPSEGFRILDEFQFERTGEITPDIVRQMMRRARLYQPDDPVHKPVRPGEGFDENQNTVILMWNPAISSIKLDEHNAAIPNLFTEYFNWSVWEHDKARCGDRFFLVRCGEGKTGIVMSGVFDSHPYEAGDWSGKGRRTFYMEMVPNVILNPEAAPMLTTAELEAAIPGFQWNGGHSGRLLPMDDARKLEDMWKQFLDKNREACDGKTFNAFGVH